MRRCPYTYAHIVHAHCLLTIAATATGVMATGHAVYQIKCCICGYHVYHRIWHPIIREVLGTTRERENEHDRYAVAVSEEETCSMVTDQPVFFSCSPMDLHSVGCLIKFISSKKWNWYTGGQAYLVCFCAVVCQ